MSNPTFAAVDLGAESGRVILGTLKENRLHIQEGHRFRTGGVHLGGHFYWDFLRLWSEIKTGLSHASTQSDGKLRSIALDTWGVDFGLLDRKGDLIGNPFHYRDVRTQGMPEAVFERVSRETVYAQTGIQIMALNSLYQLFAMVQADSPALSIAKTFLNMPDLFNYFLTGVMANEFTISSTTQCYNPVSKDWAFDLLAALDIPSYIFGEIVNPGTVLGPPQHALRDELGLQDVSVIAGAGHDTASAVAAVPATSQDYIYLSSGTWSLMGVELDEPLITAETLRENITNEGGVENRTRFLKNIGGLWLMQECRRHWSGNDFALSYDQLTQMAADAAAFKSLINPDDGCFLAPADMVSEIQSFCQKTGQSIPETKGEIVRCILESLALTYRSVSDQIDTLTGTDYPTIHIIGGGSQNKLLNQMTANATQKTVVSGPVEATAIGNILIQAMAMGEFNSLAEGREIVRNSFDVEIYEPRDSDRWAEAYQRYLDIRKINDQVL